LDAKTVLRSRFPQAFLVYCLPMNGKLFLICGDDDYLVDLAARERVNQLVPAAERDFGVDIIEGKKDTGDAVAHAVKDCMESVAMPGFVSAKVTWLRDASFLTGGGRASESVMAKAAVERLTLWLGEGLQEGQNLIITTPKVLRTSVFFKTCQKQGEVIDFGSGLKPWEREKFAEDRLESLLEQAGLQMEKAARNEFIARVGFDTRQQVQELEKLKMYLHPNVSATANDVREITSIGREADAWDVLDAFGERKAAGLLIALNQLSGQRGIGIMLAAMLEKNVRDLIILREAHDKKWVSDRGWSSHIPPETMVMLNTLPINPKTTAAWALRKKLPHAMNYTLQELRVARFRILDMREKMVSTGLPEMHLLQATLLRIIGKRRK
jgi:DNA polymerase III delta subunit